MKKYIFHIELVDGLVAWNSQDENSMYSSRYDNQTKGLVTINSMLLTTTVGHQVGLIRSKVVSAWCLWRKSHIDWTTLTSWGIGTRIYVSFHMRAWNSLVMTFRLWGSYITCKWDHGRGETEDLWRFRRLMGLKILLRACMVIWWVGWGGGELIGEGVDWAVTEGLGAKGDGSVWVIRGVKGS